MALLGNEKIYLSEETYNKYKNEYTELVTVERPAVQASLKEARAQGDLSENAEYDAKTWSSKWSWKKNFRTRTHFRKCRNYWHQKCGAK
nr:hypothetical protein [Mycoplasmopsis bovis]